MPNTTHSAPYVVLSGGVGGAKFVAGMAQHLGSDELAIITNTGDDFVHWGLNISPDLDTLMYTLAGMADPKQGWGIQNESFACMDALKNLGAADWFALGDRDLATHIQRSEWLRQGRTLSRITADLCKQLDVPYQLLPMSDELGGISVRDTHDKVYPFVSWLVEHRAKPQVQDIIYPEIRPTDEVYRSLKQAKVIFFAPSNPYVSLLPIIKMPGVRDILETKPIIAISPIINGKAVKGPLAEMLMSIDQEEPTSAAVASCYGSLVDTWVFDTQDKAAQDESIETRPYQVVYESILMPDLEAKSRVAKRALNVANRCFLQTDTES